MQNRQGRTGQVEKERQKARIGRTREAGRTCRTEQEREECDRQYRTGRQNKKGGM
jgi:hypothetical protein